MRLPIIINEGGDLSVFRTVEQAERALEAIDVKNKEYVAYDADGRSLILSVMVEERTGCIGLFPSRIEMVRLVDNPIAQVDEVAFRALLIQFLNRVEVSMDGIESDDLSSLLNALLGKVGYSS
jgi:hypothetical protein